MNKKIISCILPLIAVTACNNGSTTPSNPQSPSASIQSVQMGPMNGDSGSQFSSIITFTNNNVVNNWQFGFYMPRSFDTVVSSSVNPNLVMQICDTNNSCQELSYQVAPSVTSNDLSAGYTTILAPTANYPLEAGQTYTISLLHNNQWSPNNYSSVMQNFFIISNNQVYNFPAVNSSLYTIIGYNQASINSAINTHVSTNWTNSSIESTVNIIPTPESYAVGSGSYTLANGLAIHNTLNNDNTIANDIQTDLASDINISATVDNNSASTGIIISQLTNPSQIESNLEGYQIVISNTAINIYALNNTGAFYALQTLRQLWNQSSILSGATITDYPRFKYRGVTLDTARHFFSVAEIETLIDLAATHKLNTLHIHFSDDEGFRLGLSSYPTLSTIGDTRGYGQNNIAFMFLAANLDTTNFNNLVYPYVNTVYQGTYSASDISSLISYANSRQITIIPEIDLPGHARSLIKSLPNDFVDPNDQSVFISVQGYTDDVIPVCTYDTATSVGPKFTPTIKSIVTQIANAFNGQNTLYAESLEMSVGGDEVASAAWSNDSSCNTSPWSTYNSLEKSQYFFALLANDLPNVKFSGWQQFIQSESVALGPDIVSANQTGHVWVWNTSPSTSSGPGGILQAVQLANESYPTVLAFADETYFDLTYTPNITEPGFTWATSYADTQAALSSAVSSESTINMLNPGQAKYIVGIEGALWAENLPSYDHMIYMALPKMAGLSEAAWASTSVTNQNNQVDWKSLATRLGCGSTGFLAYLNKLYGVHYRGYPNGISLEVPSGTICQ